MTVYKIFQDGEEINRIVADEAFAQAYCSENGYTYELEPEPGLPAPAPTQIDRVEAQALYTALMTDTLLDEEV